MPTMILRRFVLVAVFSSLAAVFAEAKEWQPAKAPLTTRWTSEVSPTNVLPEYPRPQMVRAQWANLNGLWDYAIEPRESSQPDRWQGQILVPFPIESALSGVMKRVDEKQRLWYRRTFSVPKEWGDKNVLLHFDAVDWETTVWVNGKQLGSHRGGYDGFSFDITKSLKSSGKQEIVVAVWDPTEGGQPRGKQVRNPSGMTYTPSSGIWQTVWLEPVPATRIERLKITPDVDGSAVKIRVDAAGAADLLTAEVTVSDAGRAVASKSDAVGGEIVVPIAKPKLWSFDSPFLYDLKITLKRDGRVVDQVDSYFGMRKIALGKDAQGVVRMLLNGQFVFQVGPLDQGFWPDGLHTAPTDAALRYDIEMTKKLGYNATRKHIKVEPERWYYWCDRLGLLVWQDMPSPYGIERPMISNAKSQFEKEMLRMIEGRYNHPCIIMWVLFNEGQGVHDQKRLAEVAEKADPTRLINHESGEGGEEAQGVRNRWDVGAGHIIDTHSYGRVSAVPPDAKRAAVCGEFGGVVLEVREHTWGAGDSAAKPLRPSASFAKQYIDAIKAYAELKNKQGMSGIIYTQLTDVELELNGVLTYDRLPKLDVEAARQAMPQTDSKKERR